ncbi:MAG: right-handed parallel beta-helix repeat-containing protein [Patescibacteria group bacterium]
MTALTLFSLLLVGSSLPTPTADDRILYVDASTRHGGNGTCERPIGRDLHTVFQLLARQPRQYDEVWLSGVFPPLGLWPDVHSGTSERPLVFRAWDGREPPIFWSEDGVSPAIITSGNDHLVLDGLVSGGAIEPLGGLGCFVNASHDVEVRNCTFTGNGEAGMCTKESRNVRILRCRFLDNFGAGLLVPNASAVTVEENLIEGNYRGGLCVVFSNKVNVRDNVIRGNNGFGIIAGESQWIATGNHILNTTGVGIVIPNNVPPGLIEQNTFTGNTKGVHCAKSPFPQEPPPFNMRLAAMQQRP